MSTEEQINFLVENITGKPFNSQTFIYLGRRVTLECCNLDLKLAIEYTPYLVEGSEELRRRTFNEDLKKSLCENYKIKYISVGSLEAYLRKHI
jgi:hypothetical protein